MTKVNTPFFSFKSHGSIAKAITTQERAGKTLVRAKPTPTDRYTLPQAYQRWLYQDYAAWWKGLPAGTKQAWETAGRPYRMTGFAYWMKDKLGNLADLAGAWHLDLISGAQTPDSSKQGNNGTVFGALIAPGVIDQCLYFDGIDDHVACGNDASLNFDSPLTLETYIYLLSSKTHGVMSQCVGGDLRFQFLVLNTDKPHFCVTNTANLWDASLTASQALALKTWYHLAAVYTGTALHIYIDGILRDGALVGAVPTHIRATAADMELGRQTTLWLHGYLDNPIYRSRALPQPEILPHVERRYPS